MTKSVISDIRIIEVSSPLKVPYKLSFTEIHAFESIVVELAMSDGTITKAETVPLLGYSDEAYDDVLARVTDYAKSITGVTPIQARKELAEEVRRYPFSVSPLLTAIDLVQNDIDLGERESIDFVTPISTKGELSTIDTSGTYKIKLTDDVHFDIDFLSQLKVEAEKVRIRLDANQSYSVRNSQIFIEAICKLDIVSLIDYLEQPIDKDDWEGMRFLSSATDFPIMLDEPIVDKSDIQRAADLGVKFVKLKLFKQGGIKELVDQAKFARELGIGVVIGNGVATSISNDVENSVYLESRNLFYGASEANGFLKERSDRSW